MLKMYIGIFLPFTILFPVSAATAVYRRLLSAEKTAAWYLLADGIANIVAVSLAKSGINNMPVFHVYPVIEFLLLVLFFKQNLRGTLIDRYAWLFIAGFIFFAVVDALFIQSILHFNTYPRTLEALLLVGFALFFFYKRIDPAIAQKWSEEPSVWFVIAVLLYFSGALILFLFSGQLTKNSQANKLAWGIHATLLLLLYILFTVGFYRCRHRKAAGAVNTRLYAE